jgi:hypothetical protein
MLNADVIDLYNRVDVGGSSCFPFATTGKIAAPSRRTDAHRCVARLRPARLQHLLRQTRDFYNGSSSRPVLTKNRHLNNLTRDFSCALCSNGNVRVVLAAMPVVAQAGTLEGVAIGAGSGAIVAGPVGAVVGGVAALWLWTEHRDPSAPLLERSLRISSLLSA